MNRIQVLFSFVLLLCAVTSKGVQLQDSLSHEMEAAGYKADSLYREHIQDTFFPGETMHYQLFFSFIKVGEATMKVDRSLYEVNNRPSYSVKVEGKTTGIFSLTAKIRNTWGTFIDTASIVPQLFYRNIRELKYRKKEIYLFDHEADSVYVQHRFRKTGKYKSTSCYPVPNNIQDMISGFYFLRTVNYDSLKAGDTFAVPGFYKDSVYNLHIKFIGREVIKTKLGKRKALVMQPFMPDNGVFTEGSSITAWISDDKYRIPLKVKAGLKIGAGYVEIKKYIPGRMSREKLRKLPPLKDFVRPR